MACQIRCGSIKGVDPVTGRENGTERKWNRTEVGKEDMSGLVMGGKWKSILTKACRFAERGVEGIKKQTEKYLRKSLQFLIGQKKGATGTQ